MERYSKIIDKDKREIVLLIGNGCKWSKCKFCNYHLDRNNIEEEQYQINFRALERVTGEFGVLEAINSGSIFELNEKSFRRLLEVCKERKIKRLIVESHYMYKSHIMDLKERCSKLGITLQVKGGVETFDSEFREKILNKGFGYPSLSDLQEVFDIVNLLVGVKGQTLEQVEDDIKVGMENFDRVCVNLYKEMEDIMPADEELKRRFMQSIYPTYKDFENIDILVENTDFGVGE
ncbi:MAG: radical SAM protein [Clostridia bacterium]|jgi:hypothetical protein|nr:radical SAM protein [Clostridium sp.]MEE0269609.1 radical SAM protein [Clostridia bacterium]